MSDTDGATTTPRTDTSFIRHGEPSMPADHGQRDYDHGGATARHNTAAHSFDAVESGRRPVTLIAPERARDFEGRWSQLKGDFVDEPKRSVRQADELVGEVLDELERLFRDQRGELARGLDDEQTSTEDLRVALGRYRGFFDRLLSF